jgi:predicted transcriptional regulator
VIDEDLLETLHRRGRFLTLLVEDARTKRDLVDKVDVSRSTVDRAIRDLEAAGLVERTGDGYAATVAGRIVTADRDRYRRTVDGVADARSLLALLPRDADVPGSMIRDATAVHAAAPTPAAPLEELQERIAGSDRYRAVAAIDPRTGFAALYEEQVLENGLDLEFVFTEELAAYVREHRGGLWRALDEHGVDVYAVADVPHGLGIVEDGDDASAVLPVYDAQMQLAGIVFNDVPAAVDWARDTYGALRERAQVADPPAGE